LTTSALWLDDECVISVAGVLWLDDECGPLMLPASVLACNWAPGLIVGSRDVPRRRGPKRTRRDEFSHMVFYVRTRRDEFFPFVL
jgi:hypothetical protein